MRLAAGTAIDARAYFSAIKAMPLAGFIKQAEKIERDAAIERHPFFDHVMKYPSALVLWTSQEAVVTNPFSQALFSTLSNIDNVHVRALLMPVVAGEHNDFDKEGGGLAPRSHPWLIWHLCQALEIPEDGIIATSAVAQFIEVLFSSVTMPMRSLGLLGVGNELLLLAEYKAILKAFEKHFPDAPYSDFLKSNITEDHEHTRLIEMAATALHNLDHSSDEFLEGARIGVSARVAYYDALLAESQSRLEASNPKGH